MAADLPVPEQYHVRPTPHCHGNDLPVLVYRGALPQPLDEETASEFLQRHGWVKKGTWGTITTKHFHPNTHECYGIFQGTSELVFGEGGADPPGTGVTCQVGPGDVVVVPAGVAHATVSNPEIVESPAEADPLTKYRYIGVYPEGAPKWRNEFGKEEVSSRNELAREIAGVPIPPNDPVTGPGGPLVHLWTEIRSRVGA
ncbi:hypothetical protein GQ53DRAFT_791908 [Thozetella sp. PMI_491]|nr:hypothetical protein GQ53DRAFT_791908 [Thozetella sp. PMI_491]